jgi:hypothetical protein
MVTVEAGLEVAAWAAGAMEEGAAAGRAATAAAWGSLRVKGSGL